VHARPLLALSLCRSFHLGFARLARQSSFVVRAFNLIRNSRSLEMEWRGRLATIAARLADFALVAILVLFTLAVRGGHVLYPPARHGFFCGDTSIRYADVGESVNTGLVIAVGSLSVLVLALVGEHSKEDEAKKREKKCLPAWISRAIVVFLYFLLGFCVTVLVVELGKVTAGVLRYD